MIVSPKLNPLDAEFLLMLILWKLAHVDNFKNGVSLDQTLVERFEEEDGRMGGFRLELEQDEPTKRVIIRTVGTPP